MILILTRILVMQVQTAIYEAVALAPNYHIGGRGANGGSLCHSGGPTKKLVSEIFYLFLVNPPKLRLRNSKPRSREIGE